MFDISLNITLSMEFLVDVSLLCQIGLGITLSGESFVVVSHMFHIVL